MTWEEFPDSFEYEKNPKKTQNQKKPRQVQSWMYSKVSLLHLCVCMHTQVEEGETERENSKCFSAFLLDRPV